MGALNWKRLLRAAAWFCLMLGLGILAGCAVNPTPHQVLLPALPPTAREPCPKVPAADPAAVPENPDAERLFWAMRDLSQEGALAACEGRRAEAVAAVDAFIAQVSKPAKPPAWWRRLGLRR